MAITFPTGSLKIPSGITALPSGTKRPAFGTLYGYDAQQGGGGGSTVTRQSDIVHWWKFDEDLDDSAGSVTLTSAEGTFSSSNKKFGTHALDLDGVDDYAYSGDGDITDLASAYTLSCWMRPEATSGTLPGVLNVTAYSGVGGSITTNGCGMTHHATKVRYYHALTSGQEGYSGGTDSALVVDRWYFIAITHDGSNSQYWLADATDGDSTVTQMSTTDTGGSIRGSLDRIFIGYTGYAYTNGQFDDVRNYNVALSEAELNEVYNGGDGDF